MWRKEVMQEINDQDRRRNVAIKIAEAATSAKNC